MPDATIDGDMPPRRPGERVPVGRAREPRPRPERVAPSEVDDAVRHTSEVDGYLDALCDGDDHAEDDSRRKKAADVDYDDDNAICYEAYDEDTF